MGLAEHDTLSITEDARKMITITITGTSTGLGIRIVGGRTMKVSNKESYFGIFIKEVIKGSLAERDGELTCLGVLHWVVSHCVWCR